MTIGTCCPGAAVLAQNTTSSPRNELTDWRRVIICRNNCPVSEFHKTPNAAFSVDCCSARTSAVLSLPPRLGTAPYANAPAGRYVRRADALRCSVGKLSASCCSIFTNEANSCRYSSAEGLQATACATELASMGLEAACWPGLRSTCLPG